MVFKGFIHSLIVWASPVTHTPILDHNLPSLEVSLPHRISPQENLTDQILQECGIEVFSALPERENRAYGAQILDTSVGMIRVREGRATPTKPGVFVAVWHRMDSGETGPLPNNDGVDYLLVTAQRGELIGSFLIPTQALMEHGIISVEGRGGKRGFRLYPTWLTAHNPQASRTQAWQAPYFQVSYS